MAWDSSEHYFSGQGIVMLSTYEQDGSLSGYVPVGNVTDLKISVSTSVLEHKESKTGQRSVDLRLTTETKCALSMTLESFSPENLARVSRGDMSSVVSGSVTGTPIKARLGMIVALPHIKVSSVVVKDGATTLVAGTDYNVNADAGSIQFASTITGVTDGDTLTVDYSYAAQSKVDALTQGSKTYALRFEGLNTAAENTPVVVEVFRMSADPFKELALISDAVQSFVLEGSVLADGTRTTGSKFFVVKQAA